MKYNIPGFIEFNGIPKEINEKLNVGDTITDNNGKGRTVSVNNVMNVAHYSYQL